MAARISQGEGRAFLGMGERSSPIPKIFYPLSAMCRLESSQCPRRGPSEDLGVLPEGQGVRAKRFFPHAPKSFTSTAGGLWSTGEFAWGFWESGWTRGTTLLSKLMIPWTSRWGTPHSAF